MGPTRVCLWYLNHQVTSTLRIAFGHEKCPHFIQQEKSMGESLCVLFVVWQYSLFPSLHMQKPLERSLPKAGLQRISSESRHLTTHLSVELHATPPFTAEHCLGVIPAASVLVAARPEQSLESLCQQRVSFHDQRIHFSKRLSWIDFMIPKEESWFTSRIQKQVAERTVLIQFQLSW